MYRYLLEVGFGTNKCDCLQYCYVYYL